MPTQVQGFFGTLNVSHNANSNIVVELRDGNTTLDGPTSITSGATGYDLEVLQSERLSTGTSLLTANVTYPSGYTGAATFTTTTGFTVSVVNPVGTTKTYYLLINSGFLNDGNLVWAIVPTVPTGFWGSLNVSHNANSDITVELKDGNTTLDGPTDIASGATGYDLEVTESDRLSTGASSLTAVVTYPSGYTGATFSTLTGFTINRASQMINNAITYNLLINSGFLNDGNLDTDFVLTPFTGKTGFYGRFEIINSSPSRLSFVIKPYINNTVIDTVSIPAEGHIINILAVNRLTSPTTPFDLKLLFPSYASNVTIPRINGFTILGQSPLMNDPTFIPQKSVNLSIRPIDTPDDSFIEYGTLSLEVQWS